MYKILPYSYFQANKLNVDILPSKKKGKKIDVFKDGIYQASIGDINYFDYPTYAKKYGLKFANERRRLYRIRNFKTAQKKASPAFYAFNILW
jgi:hypothetical protein